MTQQEMLDVLKPQLEEFKKGIVSTEALAEAIKTIEAKIAENKNAQEVAALKGQLEEFKTAIKELKRSTDKQAESQKSFAEVIAERIQDAREKGAREYRDNFKMKAAGPVLLSGVAVTTPAATLSAIVEGDIYNINQSQGANILDYVDVGNTDRAAIFYIEEVAGEGDAAKVAEGAKKPQVQVKYKEMVSKAEKYADFVKISTEMLSDAAFLATNVREVIERKVAVQVESGVIAALDANAAAYSLTDFDGSVSMATEVDAIHAALVQSEQSGFIPNALVINPIDFGKLRFLKSTDGTPIISNYGEGRFPVFSDSLAIIKRADVPVGTFYVGDLRAIKVRFYEQSVQMGLDGTDFTENMRTIVAEQRIHMYVPSTEGKSLVKGNFATIISALNEA